MKEFEKKFLPALASSCWGSRDRAVGGGNRNKDFPPQVKIDSKNTNRLKT